MVQDIQLVFSLSYTITNYNKRDLFLKFGNDIMAA